MKNGKPYDRLVFRQETPSKKLGKFGVTYNSQQDDGKNCISVKLGGLNRDEKKVDKLLKELNASIKNSPMIEQMKRIKSDHLPNDGETESLSISLKKYGHYSRVIDVYEVPEQGKIIIDIPSY